MKQSLSICTFNYPVLYPWLNLELSNSQEALYDQRRFFFLVVYYCIKIPIYFHLFLLVGG